MAEYGGEDARFTGLMNLWDSFEDCWQPFLMLFSRYRHKRFAPILSPKDFVFLPVQPVFACLTRTPST
jgi:hypothetical protein